MSFAAKGKKENGQEKKTKTYKIKNEQTPHTVLQKLSPKPTPSPLNGDSLLAQVNYPRANTTFLASFMSRIVASRVEVPTN